VTAFVQFLAGAAFALASAAAGLAALGAGLSELASLLAAGFCSATLTV
jgi:hypothetical protein